MSGSTFNNAFGVGPIAPTVPSYLALTIAVNTTMAWPTETTGGTNYLAKQIDVTASVISLSLLMPPANTGSTGGVTIITNVGTNSFTVTDNSGNAIATIATTQTWLITLLTNTTVAGTWRGYQMASTTSSATSGSLAGAGMQAVGPLLRTTFLTRFVSVTGPISATDRATAVVWQGGLGTLTLDTIANLVTGWFCAIKNAGTDSVTLSTTGGATINGGGTSVVIHAGDSGLIVCDTTGFNTIGALITVLPVSAGGTGAGTGSAALVNLGGSALGIQIFGSPTAAATKALLGLTQSSFTESSVSTPQTLNAASSQSVFICTAALAITMPLTTTLTTGFVFCVSAVGGNVTLTPQATDAINALAVNTPLVLTTGSYAMVVTDAAGHWFTVFGPVAAITSLNLSGALTVGGNTALNGASNSSLGSFTSAGLVSTVGLVVSGGGTTLGALACTTANISGNIAAIGGTNSLTGTTTLGAATVTTSFNVGGNSILGGSLNVTGGVSLNAGGTGLSVPNGQSIFNIMQTTGSTSVFVGGWIYDGAGGGATAGTVGFGITCGGASVLAVAFFAPSDKRMKFDIEAIQASDSWHWVTTSVPVSYRKRPKWNSPDEDGVVEAGFIAQDQLRSGYGRFIAVSPEPGMPAETADDGLMSPPDAVFSVPMGYQIAMLTRALQDANERLMVVEGKGWFRRLLKYFF